MHFVHRCTHLLVCDDVRQELGNKRSYIGAYGSDIIVAAIPSILPKLCFALTVKTPKSDPLRSMEVQIEMPSSPTIKLVMPPEMLQNFEQADGDDREFEKFSYEALLISTPFEIKAEGHMTVTAILDGEEIPAGGIWVKLSEAAAS